MAYSKLEDITRDDAVLLPDACILLDLLRSPRRDSVDGASILAGRSIRDAVVQTGTVGCIVTEQVRSEISKNLPIVRNDTNRALQSLTSEINRIDVWSEALGATSQTDISHYLTRTSVAEALLSDIMDASLSHAKTSDIADRAFSRVTQNRTPAKIGKNSIEDCVVVESYLELAQDLRDQGHRGPIIFASSNTKEFLSGTPRKLNADIDAEFTTLGITYSRSLQETQHRLGLSGNKAITPAP